MAPNLMMPGNPRYQPKELVQIFGYDNTMASVGKVEIANLQTLGEIGVIPAHEIALLTPDVIEKVLAIPTSEVDTIERSITHHDILAWIYIARQILPEPLRRWLHVPLTSYDSISTAYALQFSLAHQQVLVPKTRELIGLMAAMVRKQVATLQIGRTHGQHALPITVGFWMATILSRIMYCTAEIDRQASSLVGKLSGAVGAYNAQVGLNMDTSRRGQFEAKVLARLGLKPARISTQITPPEPIAMFLFSCLMLSAALGQFGRDGRNLMRSEIGEIREDFEENQGGSSTMAHKRNPINFENLEGTWLKTKCEFGKVLECMISDHQRDLVGSSIMRDFPIIVINLTHQLNTLLKKNKQGTPFIMRVSVDAEACQRNFQTSSKVILAEPMYIAMQMAGYPGDAHALVNKRLMRRCTHENISLLDAMIREKLDDEEVARAFDQIPHEILVLLTKPETYTGLASQKALEIADLADDFVKTT
ncbi:MAG: lyase family protein [Patescibacteria group bacterium]|nr:lyase family protein [Patescibacteria group bacterium]